MFRLPVKKPVSSLGDRTKVFYYTKMNDPYLCCGFDQAVYRRGHHFWFMGEHEGFMNRKEKLPKLNNGKYLYVTLEDGESPFDLPFAEHTDRFYFRGNELFRSPWGLAGFLYPPQSMLVHLGAIRHTHTPNDVVRYGGFEVVVSDGVGRLCFDLGGNDPIHLCGSFDCSKYYPMGMVKAYWTTLTVLDSRRLYKAIQDLTIKEALYYVDKTVVGPALWESTDIVMVRWHDQWLVVKNAFGNRCVFEEE